MKQQPKWIQLSIGGLTALLGTAALVWVLMLFSAEYTYRAVSMRTRMEKLDRQALITYSVRLQELTSRDPNNGEIRNMYANVLARLGEYQKAVDELKIARRTLNARNSLNLLSDMYEKMGNIAKAEEMMADCLLINPADTEFNPARLHLLGAQLVDLSMQKRRGQLKDASVYDKYRKAYAEAALNWGIRAPNDKNSFLFLGNFYIDPLYPLQAYRCFLMGLSGSPWLDLNPRAMVDTEKVLVTIKQILNYNYAKQYRGLP